MLTIGIDPGIRGAIAAIDEDSLRAVEDMPIRSKKGNGKVKNEIDPKALRDVLRKLIPADQAAIVVMEALNTFAGGSVQTMGSLEATKAVICTVCELSGFDVAFVTPREWQKWYGVKATPSETTKQQSLRIARHLFGMDLFARAKDDGRADAALIARWAQRALA
jgi:hypothetical protein